MAFALGALLLATCIVKVVRLLKASELSRAALVERQEVVFADAGPVVLCIEGPPLSRRFVRLDFALESSDGGAVAGRANWFRLRSSGFSKARLQLLTYLIPRPGRYVLRIGGLGLPQTRDAEHAIIFAKPHAAAAFGYVLGMVVAGWLLIGGIVLFALSVLPMAE
ncbi:hypothetical protein [Methylogaea oryzae]|uniref:Uncharacterized protein n=1 Tax=Methylogaea oryzae TaxID=1295382 RepID=A0A8D4VLQ3_9GAMM|nr:hypothetical protein [Methylogaea oryzae]BBL70158.1 hypothetical protein MoryE10_07640 [Methylogaea oryzae]